MLTSAARGGGAGAPTATARRSPGLPDPTSLTGFDGEDSFVLLRSSGRPIFLALLQILRPHAPFPGNRASAVAIPIGDPSTPAAPRVTRSSFARASPNKLPFKLSQPGEHRKRESTVRRRRIGTTVTQRAKTRTMLRN
jgi:hypothetical protein